VVGVERSRAEYNRIIEHNRTYPFAELLQYLILAQHMLIDILVGATHSWRAGWGIDCVGEGRLL
jgi:hypothetical protein